MDVPGSTPVRCAACRRGGSGDESQVRVLVSAARELFRIGRWAEAEAVISAALHPRPSGAVLAELLLMRCQLRLGTGDVEAVGAGAAGVEAAGVGAAGVGDTAELRAGLAIWQGRYEDARSAVRRGLADHRRDDPARLAVLAWHGLRTEAQARIAGERTDPGAIRRLRSVPVDDGYAMLCAAELDRIADRRDPLPWARAAGFWDRHRYPYPAAYARLREAEAALLRGTHGNAAAITLRDAHTTAVTLGARPLAAEIAAVARRFRVTLTVSGSGGPLSALTRREYEVLVALAEGLTNRQIGRRLHISGRTVGVHVGHIFDKLQVRTRVQATTAFLIATRDVTMRA